MSRLFPLFPALVAWSSFVPLVSAADSSLSQDVHELRRDVQMQAKKIEALSDQILRLTQLVEERGRVTAIAPPPPSAPGVAAAPPAESAKVKTETAKAKPDPEIPKAEAVLPSHPHTVAKGETLTSIAKQYNIPLNDLQKLNKITNDRKLQIGQTLNVPVPAAPAPEKAPDAPAAKKENP